MRSYHGRAGLADTMSDLLDMRMIPVLNGNDAVSPSGGGESVRREGEGTYVTMVTYVHLIGCTR